MAKSPEQKAFERAKVQLMRGRDTHFFTTILFSLKQSWDKGIDTACTNGTHLVLSPDFFLQLDEPERIGLLLHEVNHVALNHMTRRGDRHPLIWNYAADHVINLSLLEAGYKLPANGLWDPQFKGMHTVQVYNILYDKHVEEVKMGGSGADGWVVPGGQDIDEPKTTEEVEVAKLAIADIVKRATIVAQAASKMPGQLPGECMVELEKITNPVLPWNVLLQNYMSSFAKDDYTWRRPNRRYMPDWYMPTAYSEAVGKIATAVDASSSVEDHEFAHFIGEHVVIQETLHPEQIDVISFDTDIKEIQQITEYTDILSELKFTGRGGTNVTPVLDWAKMNDPVVLLVFTDGDFYMPDEEHHPTCPVLWLIHDNPDFTAPFGEVIHYDIPKGE